MLLRDVCSTTRTEGEEIMIMTIDRQLGYMLPNGDTVCNDCITGKEKKIEIAIYQSEYKKGLEPICDRCQCTMTGDDDD